jgi:large subunit ribosomal protein L35
MALVTGDGFFSRSPFTNTNHCRNVPRPALAGWTASFIFHKKEKIVPKIKTNRGAAKRFKKTGTGKIKAKRAFARHILTKKSANRKRGLRRPKSIAQEDAKGIKTLIPYI